MEWKKVQKLIEAVNTYYAFAVLLYVAAIYIASHNHLFWWLLLAVTPFLAGWTGYLLQGFITRRNLRYGFKVLSDVMTYEIMDRQKTRLRFTTKLKAEANHLMVYPIGYQWTGKGDEGIPTVEGPDNVLLGVIESKADAQGLVKVNSFKEVIPGEGNWNYWFIELNPPAYKGDEVEIRYSQEFYDRKMLAKPYIYYFVRTPMEKLELNVKFPENAVPKVVTGSYIKPSDPRRAFKAKGVIYEPDVSLASWKIARPKKGYCYRISWQ